MSEKRITNMESEGLKMLRLERKDSVVRTREAIKEQNKVIKSIRKALADAPKTIPELAEAVSMETEPVLMYISTLKRYGIIGEGVKDGDYFKYELLSS